MAYKHVGTLLHGRKGNMKMSTMRYSHSEHIPSEWFGKAFPQMVKLSLLLKNVDLIDGRLLNIHDGSTVIDKQMEQRMHTFKSLARAFIGSPWMQQAVKKNMAASADGICRFSDCFCQPNEREAMTVNSLTIICNFLKISAQQRKEVRLTVCPQVTQHRIWVAALQEMLNGLKSEMESLEHHHHHHRHHHQWMMGQQIITSCLNFLADNAVSSDPDSVSWMRPAPGRVPQPSSHKWEEVLEMFNHLIKCLRTDDGLHLHVSKLEAMKEGLFHIKDVLVDGNIRYKDARHQETLVQKKLVKMLGHSSPCLFTLLVYYLYGGIRDIKVEVSGGVQGIEGRERFCLYMGKILTTDEEEMVWSGVKQLDRALGLFKFVWETANMQGVLELQGHLWCIGAKERSFRYRENVFYVHRIRL